MDDRPSSEIERRGGDPDAISDRYRNQKPNSISYSWSAFTETVRNEDDSIEYIAALQRALADLDQYRHGRDIYTPKSSQWETRIKQRLIERYSFAIPTKEALRYLVDRSPVVELGAWDGYWAYEIDRLGGEITAFDLNPVLNPWYPVSKADQDVLLSTDESATLFLCWPPVGGMAYEALLLHDGDVVYIGELPGEGFKAFADMRFFDTLEARYEQVDRLSLPSHPGAKDDLYHFRPTR